MTADITQRLAEIKERWPVTDSDEREATQDIRYLLAKIERLQGELSNVRKNQPAVSVSHGHCDTTLTERFSIDTCKCDTYAENLGPCKTWLDNGNGRCSYCDHGPICHIAVLQPAAGGIVCPVCNGGVPRTTT